MLIMSLDTTQVQQLERSSCHEILHPHLTCIEKIEHSSKKVSNVGSKQECFPNTLPRWSYLCQVLLQNRTVYHHSSVCYTLLKVFCPQKTSNLQLTSTVSVNRCILILLHTKVTSNCKPFTVFL